MDCPMFAVHFFDYIYDITNPINVIFMIGLIFLSILFPLLAVVFIFIVPMWKIFVKAGEPGWGCIIPSITYLFS